MMAGAIGGQMLNMMERDSIRSGALSDYKSQLMYNKEFQKEMADYMLSKDLEKWEKTGVQAQVEQMKKAGLNTALMYGQGGGTGATGVTAPSGGASMSPVQGNNNVASMMQAAQNQELINAQIDNIKADTENKSVNTDKQKEETNKVSVEIKKIIAETSNTKAKERLIELQSEYQGIMNYVGGATADYNIEEARQKWELFEKDIEYNERRNYIQRETAETIIKQAKADYVKTLLENQLTKATTDLTKQKKFESESNVKLNEQKIQESSQYVKKMINEISNDNTRIWQEWDKIEWGQKLDEAYAKYTGMKLEQAERQFWINTIMGTINPFYNTGSTTTTESTTYDKDGNPTGHRSQTQKTK